MGKPKQIPTELFLAIVQYGRLSSHPTKSLSQYEWWCLKNKIICEKSSRNGKS
jgi:hypothetical protein